MSGNDNKFSFGSISEDYTDATQRNLPKLTLTQPLESDPHSRGVNPYDRDPAHKPAGQTQRTDLRKLSEWIKLQKQVEAQKAAGPDEDDTDPSLPPDAAKP